MAGGLEVYGGRLEVYGGRAMSHGSGRDAGRTIRRAVTVHLGADRPGGATGFEELVSQARSDTKRTARVAGDLAIAGYRVAVTGVAVLVGRVAS